MSFSIFHLISLFLLCSFLQKSSHAIKKSYIVYLGSHSHGPNPSASDLESATNSHYNLLGSHLGSHEKAKEAIFYSYNKHINGFSAVLEVEEAANIAKHPNVVSVFVNKGHELQTTRSWEFLGLENNNGVVLKDSIWEKARYGEGVWPESKSFSDHGMGPVPSRWRGICQLHNFHCNRKLIGARFYSKGYESKFGRLNQSEYTARDVLGHGTPTLSIAGGNFVPGANVFGFGNGTAKGGSPRSHVAAYKVCWLGTIQIECTDADIMKAFEDAISDGVNVISCSLGKTTPPEFFEDGISIGSFHAIQNGVIVVASGGNSGPKLGTVTNVAPWLFSVGASTIDRKFVNYIQLGGDNKHIMGVSLSTGLPSDKFYSLISSVDAKLGNATIDDAQICMVGTIDPNKVKGKILFCLLRDINGLYYAEEEAVSGGAIGLILGNDKQRGNDIIAYPHLLPTSHINYIDANYVHSYIKATKTPVAYMSKAKTEVGAKPSPVIASLSSRGPNPIQSIILKPDISAPGVDILYAFIGAISPTGLASDNRRIPYYIGSGTSVSCPHVSAIVALLKTLYPHWSPAAFKSAVMTTAKILDTNERPIRDQSNKEDATPFGYGAGHIQPELAMDPGLIYDLNTIDYLNFLSCSRGYNQTNMKIFSKRPHTCPKSYNMLDFNYPSITVPNLGKLHSVQIVTRTVTNVGSPSTYHVHVKTPYGISVLVKPSSLTFNQVGEKKTFKVVLKVTKPTLGYVFGHLWWFDGRHKVMSPLVVKHS
ncbi:subtilisin-like protease SBT5.4 isoform X2 [Cicer arietinum]|uniref:subtilisin-like protease SBT5.4 isoform X2 n=1 Tax=Cicer arietinum TaxID=3827 RepID=UPI003CC5647A